MNAIMPILRIILLSMALVYVGCSETVCLESSEVERSVELSVMLPCNSTKALNDGDGDGKFIDRCRLQIWLKDSLCLDCTAPVKNLSAKFSNIIIKNNPEYQFLFWADCSEGNFYNTDNLKKVIVEGQYCGNDDRRDAFCGCASSDEVKVSAEGDPIMLRRPFGQINVITTDIADFIEYAKEGRMSLLEEFFPKSVRVRFTAPQQFDVSTMTGNELKEFAYSSKIYSNLLSSNEPYNRTLSMDYVFPLDENKFLTDVEFALEGNAEASVMKFSSVPVQRNYRTCVIGRLLTLRQLAVVSISTEWYDENDQQPEED